MNPGICLKYDILLHPVLQRRTEIPLREKIPNADITHNYLHLHIAVWDAGEKLIL